MTTFAQMTTRPPVDRRLLGLDRRYLIPSVVVVLVALLWTVVLPAVDGAIRSPALAAGSTVTLAHGVSYAVTSDWVVRGELLGSAPPEVTVYRDGVAFTVASGAFTGTATALLDTETGRQHDVQVTGDRRTVPQAQGFDGVATPLDGTDSSGALFAFVQPGSTSGAAGTGVVVTVKGRPDTLPQLTDDIARMVASVRFTVTGGGS